MNQIWLHGITIQQLADALKPLLKPQSIIIDDISHNDLATRDQACEMLSINKTTLYKHTKSGKLKSYGLGNRVFYKRSELLLAVKPLNK